MRVAAGLVYAPPLGGELYIRFVSHNQRTPLRRGCNTQLNKLDPISTQQGVLSERILPTVQ
jgi:hypothetical protein